MSKTLVPSIKKALSLKAVSCPRISPDGKLLAYLLREVDWEGDCFVRQLWIVDATGRNRRKLTGGKDVSSPEWSPDGNRIGFLRVGNNGKGQLWTINPSGGEALCLTDSSTGVLGFRWSPDARSIAYHTQRPDSQSLTDRRERYGDFEEVDVDIHKNGLWVLDLKTRCSTEHLVGSDLSVEAYCWSPCGRRLALELALDPRPKGLATHGIYVYDPEAVQLQGVAVGDGPNTNPVWSPDGKRLAYNSTLGMPGFFHRNRRISVVPADGGKSTVVTRSFDESADLICWHAAGIYFSATQRVYAHLFLLDPATHKVSRISAPEESINRDFDICAEAGKTVFMRNDAKSMQELFVAELSSFSVRRLTRASNQITRFRLGSREILQWTSRDGLEIEGVLCRPHGFDSSKQYPLLVVIHGGPMATSRPQLDLMHNVYPVEQWLARGAVILNPNYRGSVGYGEVFLSKNVRNLGIGDAWDVLSGVDHLCSQGFIDQERMGVMGWSQGGFISAYLSTHSDRFAAASVGAGISNWMTYYVNTDLTPFTRQYLLSTPWEDPGIYEQTSPMSAIHRAKTPTLIQHGSDDRRVPIANAYELRQGMEDHGVPVRMLVYKGAGHVLTKPKSVLAAAVHNLEWFDKWVWP